MILINCKSGKLCNHFYVIKNGNFKGIDNYELVLQYYAIRDEYEKAKLEIISLKGHIEDLEAKQDEHREIIKSLRVQVRYVDITMLCQFSWSCYIYCFTDITYFIRVAQSV